MQSSSSPFVVNIVPLANVNENTGGLDPTTALSNSLANIQQMVNYEQKRIYTDYISAYTTDATIQVLSPMNMSNVPFTTNGIPISDGSSPSTTTTSTTILFSDTTSPTETAMSFQVNQRPVFQILGNGDQIAYDSLGIATEFRVSSMSFIADSATLSTLSVTDTATIGGVCYAQQFVTLSDERRKHRIQTIDSRSVISSLSGVRPYTYRLISEEPQNEETSREIGLLAQELEGVFPECVVTKGDTKYVKYHSVVALLVGAVRELHERVESLNSRLNS